MGIIETSIFTKRVKEVLDNEQYRLFQLFLVQNPDAGSVIKDSGGIRKIRWAGSGRGKRGRTRILYFWFNKDDTILLLFVFKKNEQDDLTKEQLKLLKSIVENEYI